MGVRSVAFVLASVILLSASCDQAGSGKYEARPHKTGLRGHLLAIGGGLEDDNKPVYERFITLTREAAKSGAPRILIATAASLNEEPAGRIEIIRKYCPECQYDAIVRATPTEDTVKLIDAASAMFFTGGDQKRITTRYLADGKDTPEAAAMRRLLARGGVIAGTSAGDAMMSDPMFLSGGSAEALGITMTRMRKGAPGLSPAGPIGTEISDDEVTSKPAEEAPPGPRIGKGIGFFPWAIADSHFFERHRFGRLVAALETSGKRLGIGVSENACVEINLETGEAIGVGAAESLLVDIGGIKREGLTRRNIRTFVIKQGRTISLVERMNARIGEPPTRPMIAEHLITVATRRDRRDAARRFFSYSAKDESDDITRRLNLDGYDQFAWPAGLGWSVVDIEPHLIDSGVEAKGEADNAGR